jgi:hypothetical protein
MVARNHSLGSSDAGCAGPNAIRCGHGNGKGVNGFPDARLIGTLLILLKWKRRLRRLDDLRSLALE